VGHLCPPGSGSGSTDLIESGSETLLVSYSNLMLNFVESVVQERHHLEFQSILESMRKREKEEKVERARRQAEQRRLEDDLSAAATVW
jgi:hypothetical protein